MSDSTGETEVRQRKVSVKESAENEAESKTSQVESTKPQEALSTWGTVKYYFYRFRYYHFKVAETIDLYASAACLWVINLYFKLFMGIGSEPPSVLTEEN